MNASSKNIKPKEPRKMSTNSFIIQSQRSISKQNLFRNSFNLLEQKSAKSKHGDQKIHSEFSSCVNLMNPKNIDKSKGLVMAASTIFDQFKNA